MICHRKIPSLVLVLILGACNGVSKTTTTPGDGAPETTAGSTTTTPVGLTTSTSGATTTSLSIDRADLPYAQPDSPAWEVLFSIPVGPDGVTYEGGFEDWVLSGPQALAVASDGSVWIADTNGRRLLQFEDGSLLANIDTDRLDVAGLIDVAAVDGGVWGLEVLPALNRHRIVLFDDAGQLLDSYDLPSGLHLGDGLWGIATAPEGRLWVELEGGAGVYSAFDSAGGFAPEKVEGYEIQGATVRPASAIEGGMARFEIGDITIEKAVREQGGITLEGAIPGWVALLLSDVALDDSGTLRVDLEVLYADFEGNIAATATYPLDEVAATAYVPQDFIAVAPDGRLIAMKPTPDGLDIIELSLFAASAERLGLGGD